MGLQLFNVLAYGAGSDVLHVVCFVLSAL